MDSGEVFPEVVDGKATGGFKLDGPEVFCSEMFPEIGKNSYAKLTIWSKISRCNSLIFLGVETHINPPICFPCLVYKVYIVRKFHPKILATTETILVSEVFQ